MNKLILFDDFRRKFSSHGSWNEKNHPWSNSHIMNTTYVLSSAILRWSICPMQNLIKENNELMLSQKR